jgi:hypothetical protein
MSAVGALPATEPRPAWTSGYGPECAGLDGYVSPEGVIVPAIAP